MRQRSDLSVEGATTAEGIPVAPDMTEPRVPIERAFIDKRVVLLCLCSVILAVATGFIAQGLVGLIGIVTNIAFYGRFSTRFVSPAGNHLGWLVLVVPAIGGLIVGVMARYGSKAIRGHGIPEAMEQVLLNESRIPARLTLLKPISAAFAIGTGGPFGAEGPIIATGGALGSLLGQVLKTTGAERTALLSGGAAAGMAATFGSPVSAVLLAVELLLFELRPRSLIPCALAAATATGVRIAFVGSAPAFAMPNLGQPHASTLVTYIVLGALVGVVSLWVTRAVYAVEDAFEHIPVHWMWWPAIGAVAVGICGYFAPHTLGVGYDNIDRILSGDMTVRAVAFLCVMKFISWCISLGSGTSGGTPAPLFTIGGGLGATLGAIGLAVFPGLGIDIRVAALVGMAAMFTGASRALLASVVFAFETTRQPMGLLPLLGGCSAAVLISCLFMRNTIMTEKIARRGGRVPGEYAAHFLDQIQAGVAAAEPVVSLRADQTLADVRAFVQSGVDGSSHQGFPVVDGEGLLVGVVTRRDILDPNTSASRLVRDLVRRSAAVSFADSTLREAADHMVREGVGRLPVVTRDEPRKVIGMLTRSDLLSAHRKRLEDADLAEQHLDLRALGRRRPA